MVYVFNPFTGTFDLVNTQGISNVDGGDASSVYTNQNINGGGA